MNSAESTAALTDCDDTRIENLGLNSRASLGGLELAREWPSLHPGRTLTSMRVLTAIKPTFEALCSTIYQLGWNDLIFQTEGTLCFRGNKVAGSPAAARRISNHGYAIAMDIMPFENPPGERHSTVDPRIVAIFEAFRYRWGKSFPTPDPMHFDYHG